MNANQILKSMASIEQQIESINLSRAQRDQVLRSARVAEAFVGVLVWIYGKVQRPNADVFAKPSLN